MKKRLLVILTFVLVILSANFANENPISGSVKLFLKVSDTTVLSYTETAFTIHQANEETSFCINVDTVYYENYPNNQYCTNNYYLRSEIEGGMFMCPVCGGGNAISGNIINDVVYHPCIVCGQWLKVTFRGGDIVDIEAVSEPENIRMKLVL